MTDYLQSAIAPEIEKAADNFIGRLFSLVTFRGRQEMTINPKANLVGQAPQARNKRLTIDVESQEVSEEVVVSLILPDMQCWLPKLLLLVGDKCLTLSKLKDCLWEIFPIDKCVSY